MGSCGWPSASACALPSETNAVEQIVIPAWPRFKISTLSWTLHDVHDPQSPDPAITRSHWFASSSITLCGAGMEAPRFPRLITFAAP